MICQGSKNFIHYFDYTTRFIKLYIVLCTLSHCYYSICMWIVWLYRIWYGTGVFARKLNITVDKITERSYREKHCKVESIRRLSHGRTMYEWVTIYMQGEMEYNTINIIITKATKALFCVYLCLCAQRIHTQEKWMKHIRDTKAHNVTKPFNVWLGWLQQQWHPNRTVLRRKEFSSK